MRGLNLDGHARFVDVPSFLTSRVQVADFDRYLRCSATAKPRRSPDCGSDRDSGDQPMKTRRVLMTGTIACSLLVVFSGQACPPNGNDMLPAPAPIPGL